jgi:hypothetical protein
MSVKQTHLLRQQIGAGDYVKAAETAKLFQRNPGIGFDEFIQEIHYAVNVRQAEIALVLLAECPRFFESVRDADKLEKQIDQLIVLLASCRREKMDEPARQLVEFVVHLLENPEFPVTQGLVDVVAKFAGVAGRYALRRKDLIWFGQIALPSVSWATRCENCVISERFFPVLESWMHRITSQALFDGVPVFFEAAFLLLMAENNKPEFIDRLLREWRTVTATACLNPENPLASQWVEQLLLLTIRIDDRTYWRPVAQKITEVASLAVSRYGVAASFSVIRPLLDVGRVNLADELKFGSGPDDSSLRQLIIRLACNAAIHVADMASHADFSAVTGDKLEEMYHSWLRDPSYESQARSIERFCQLLLIFWSLNRKRAARKWTPREEKLSASLFSDEEREKLSFLL